MCRFVYGLAWWALHTVCQINGASGEVDMSACPMECRSPKCRQGVAFNGGRPLHGVNKSCVAFCSIEYNGLRYCGRGPDYEMEGSIECSECPLRHPTPTPTQAPTPVPTPPTPRPTPAPTHGCESCLRGCTWRGECYDGIIKSECSSLPGHPGGTWCAKLDAESVYEHDRESTGEPNRRLQATSSTQSGDVETHPSGQASEIVRGVVDGFLGAPHITDEERRCLSDSATLLSRSLSKVGAQAMQAMRQGQRQDQAERELAALQSAAHLSRLFKLVSALSKMCLQIGQLGDLHAGEHAGNAALTSDGRQQSIGADIVTELSEAVDAYDKQQYLTFGELMGRAWRKVSASGRVSSRDVPDQSAASVEEAAGQSPQFMVGMERTPQQTDGAFYLRKVPVQSAPIAVRRRLTGAIQIPMPTLQHVAGMRWVPSVLFVTLLTMLAMRARHCFASMTESASSGASAVHLLEVDS